jgi:hypothetical protein
VAIAEPACSGVVKLGNLTADAVAASLGVAPLRCGKSLDIVNTREDTASKRAFATPKTSDQKP